MTRPITPELIARTGAALADGGWRYTPRQLYYATCAAAETPPRSPARGPFALGVLLGLTALILLPIRPAALAVGALAALSLAFAVLMRVTPHVADGRVLAVSYDEFERRLRESPEPPGLITAGAAPLAAASPRAETVSVVCDTAENAAAVACNLSPAELPAVSVTTLDTAGVAGSTVIALHDASPRGCALALELADAGARVIDAGMRPEWVGTADVQVLEGAPARMPRELSPALTDDELDWLRSGRRAELAVLPPQRLMQLVRSAIDRAGA